jgi:hypothetical protein
MKIKRLFTAVHLLASATLLLCALLTMPARAATDWFNNQSGETLYISSYANGNIPVGGLDTYLPLGLRGIPTDYIATGTPDHWTYGTLEWISAFRGMNELFGHDNDGNNIDLLITIWPDHGITIVQVPEVTGPILVALVPNTDANTVKIKRDGSGTAGTLTQGGGTFIIQDESDHNWYSFAGGTWLNFGYGDYDWMGTIWPSTWHWDNPTMYTPSSSLFPMPGSDPTWPGQTLPAQPITSISFPGGVPPTLTHLFLGGNQPGLAPLVEGCPIQTLDVAYSNLEDIEAYGCQHLTHVAINNCPNLWRFTFEQCDLTTLDLSGDLALRDVRAAMNYSGNPNNDANYHMSSITLPQDANGHNAIEHLCVRSNPHLAPLALSTLAVVKDLYIWNCGQSGEIIASVVDSTHNNLPSTALTDLEVYDNHLTKLNVSGQSNLRYLFAQNNDLTEVRLQGCFNLFGNTDIGHPGSYEPINLSHNKLSMTAQRQVLDDLCENAYVRGMRGGHLDMRYQDPETPVGYGSDRDQALADVDYLRNHMNWTIDVDDWPWKATPAVVGANSDHYSITFNNVRGGQVLVLAARNYDSHPMALNSLGVDVNLWKPVTYVPLSFDSTGINTSTHTGTFVVWCCVVPAGISGDVVATVTSASTWPWTTAANGVAITGADPNQIIDALEVKVGQVDSAGDMKTAAIAPTYANDMLVIFAADGDGGTAPAIGGVSGVPVGAYQILGGSSGLSVTPTLNSTWNQDHFAMVAVAFKAPGTAAINSAPRYYLHENYLQINLDRANPSTDNTLFWTWDTSPIVFDLKTWPADHSWEPRITWQPVDGTSLYGRLQGLSFPGSALFCTYRDFLGEYLDTYPERVFQVPPQPAPESNPLHYSYAAPQPITLVQSQFLNYPGNSVTLNTDTVAGHLLVCVSRTWDHDLDGISDSLGNNWISVAPEEVRYDAWGGGQPESGHMRVWYCISTNSGPNTVTVSSSGTISMEVAEFSGVDTNNPVDVSGWTNGIATTDLDGFVAPTLTPTYGGDLLVVFSANSSDPSPAIGSGFYDLASGAFGIYTSLGDGAFTFGEYKILPDFTPIAPAISSRHGAGDNYGIIAVGFRPQQP